MRPASSLIVFTTLTGAGYGLLFWLGIGAGLGMLPRGRGFAAAALGTALLALAAGLLSSVGHLGRPERAWRALSQWRSSWLSREGVMALASFVPALAFAYGSIADGRVWQAAAFITAAFAATTVFCTAQIYRSLRPVAQWNLGLVPANFLALAAMSGALWLTAFVAIFSPQSVPAYRLAIATILVASAMKLAYWRRIGREIGASTVESATGLGALGRVRPFEAPHVSENYLLKEMGFAVARKHRDRLRRISFELAFVVPLLLMLLALAETGAVRVAVAILAPPLATAGVAVERWLFFAEAKHTVTLFYGTAEA
ncbi:MAG TPA: DmsC/YnfH family molybdoenzyme membrane anchor subunit [Stellaceae bacterium]|nr:DmsC/YnfH family molybdoenzyme membrane anchor subunit [Stellaceae bacterium]